MLIDIVELMLFLFLLLPLLTNSSHILVKLGLTLKFMEPISMFHGTQLLLLLLLMLSWLMLALTDTFAITFGLLYNLILLTSLPQLMIQETLSSILLVTTNSLETLLTTMLFQTQTPKLKFHGNTKLNVSIVPANLSTLLFPLLLNGRLLILAPTVIYILPMQLHQLSLLLS